MRSSSLLSSASQRRAARTTRRCTGRSRSASATTRPSAVSRSPVRRPTALRAFPRCPRMAEAVSGCSSAQTQSSRSAIRSCHPLAISHLHSLWTRPSMNARPRRPKASHRTAYQRHPSPNSAEYLTSTRMRSRKQTSRCHRPRVRHGRTPSTWCNKPQLHPSFFSTFRPFLNIRTSPPTQITHTYLRQSAYPLYKIGEIGFFIVSLSRLLFCWNCLSPLSTVLLVSALSHTLIPLIVAKYMDIYRLYVAIPLLSSFLLLFVLIDGSQSQPSTNMLCVMQMGRQGNG